MNFRQAFAMDNWTLKAEAPATRSESYLTLVFERRNGKWLMVQDQNTPIK